MSQGIHQKTDRRRDIRAALTASAENDTITNTEMMNLWGVTKGAWTSVRNTIARFPTPVLSGNIQLYPRRAALQAMLDHETRNDQSAADKARRLAALVGIDHDDDSAMPTLSDMIKASQLSAEMQARAVEQKKLVAAAAVQVVAGKIFELLSRRLSGLGTLLDPNGILPIEMREQADKVGSDLLLQLHANMQDMLAPNGTAFQDPPARTGSEARTARAAAKPGQRRGRVAKPA